MEQVISYFFSLLFFFCTTQNLFVLRYITRPCHKNVVYEKKNYGVSWVLTISQNYMDIVIFLTFYSKFYVKWDLLCKLFYKFISLYQNIILPVVAYKIPFNPLKIINNNQFFLIYIFCWLMFSLAGHVFSFV